jgi:hypothetical protein
VAFIIEGGPNPRHQPAGGHISSNATLTRNECGEYWSGKPAAFNRRFIMRQMSIALIGLFVSSPVLPRAVRNKGPSVIVAAGLITITWRLTSRSKNFRCAARQARFAIDRDIAWIPHMLFSKQSWSEHKIIQSLAQVEMERPPRPARIGFVGIWSERR